MKINQKLLPVKTHFFFFMAASGPILPYLTVYGKQLGISEVVMGTITAVVPLTFLLAKPLFGFVADYFYARRKLVFMALIMSLAVFYLGLYFIPPVNIELKYAKAKYNLTTGWRLCDGHESLSFNTSDLVCNVTCLTNECRILGINTIQDLCYRKVEPNNCNWTEFPAECHDNCFVQIADGARIFRAPEFYGFVVLMTLSMIAFNVSNSMSDAICFDMLGEGGKTRYGYQRVWGTVGFGLSAFLGGVGMDLWAGEDVKNYTLAFALVFVFTGADMICCSKLQLPKLAVSENILKDLNKVLKNRFICVFLVFATLVGVLDGFVIYFMFWFLEDVAEGSEQIRHIKALEGLTVAAETLGGEVIFFLLSGKILKKLGFGHTLTLCFFNYSLRLGLISLIFNPWWILAVELLMQGPTYALCYSTIVAYANAISPPGTSATMQGIVAGMDDGFGYALGSLLGGFLYRAVGGRLAFQLFSFLSLFCCVTHMILHKLFLRKSYDLGGDKEYKPPREALEMMQTLKAKIPAPNS